MNASRNRRAGPRALLVGALVSLAVASCDGNNLFGPGVGVGPTIINFLAPVSVPSGQEMSLQARAVALVRVDSIVFTATGGDFALRRVQLSQANQNDFTTTAAFNIPRPIVDTLIVVSGTAYDAQGNRSLSVFDTVRAVDTTPPTLAASVMTADSVVGQGRSLRVSVQASDNIGLRWIGYRILNADSMVVASDSVVTSGKTRNQTFTFPVPVDLPLGRYSAAGFAHDLDGNVAATAPSVSSTTASTMAFRVIFIDDVRPVVAVTAPAPGATVAEGDSVLVTVRVTDNDKVRSLRFQGVALRGDPGLGTDQIVERFTPRDVTLTNASADTTVSRYLRATSVLGQEAVSIIVTATDQQGNVGTATVSVSIVADVSPPVVVIEIPGDGAAFPIGDSISIRATVSDPNGTVRTGVTQVQFQGIALRGDPTLLTQQVVPRLVSTTVNLTPPRVSPQTILRALAPTADTTEENALLIVTATDARGNVGADTVIVALQDGIGGPSVVILDPTSGSGVPTGDSIRVRARMQHPDGTVRVVYDGVAHRGDPDLGTDQVVPRFTARTINLAAPSTDTTITRFLQPTGGSLSETVWIRAFAFDASDFVGADSVAITVGGPSVTVADLVSGQIIPGGQNLPITVRAQDPSGIDVVEVEIGGVVAPPVIFQDAVLAGQPDPNNVEVTFNFLVPATPGQMTISARARNNTGILGSAPVINLTITGAAGPDVTPPEVRIAVAPQGGQGDLNRIEATDTIRVSITARDNTGGSGVLRFGYTARIVRRNNLADTLWVTDTIPDAPVPPGVAGTVTQTFRPTFLTDFRDAAGNRFFDPVNRPDTLDIEFFGWASDAAAVPNCAAAVSSTTFQQIPCQSVAIPAAAVPPSGARSSVKAPGGGAHLIATGTTGQRVTVALVSGQTVKLPLGGRIADAVVDTAMGRERVYVANIGLSRLEVFDLTGNTFGTANTFGAPVLVGAEPWGMSFDRTNANQLLVANSGGTNLSYVNLTTLAEIESLRIFTPNQFLVNIQETTSQAGGITFIVDPVIDFSDRPQFVEMDSQGRLVYSTRPTGVSPDGTVRIAQLGANPLVPEPLNRPQITIFTDYAQGDPNDGWFATTNICCAFESGPSIRLGAHDPFTPRVNPPVQLTSASYVVVGGTGLAVADLAGQAEYPALPPVFRPRASGGQKWNVENVGLQDTTFIAAAGDGSRIAIGEGASPGTGRIILWDAANTIPSAAVEVVDLVNNASEIVLGVAMNQDGRLGVARGTQGAYFFDPDLRLQGTVAVSAGGGGVALHPLHTVAANGTQPVGSRLAFVPVGNRTIEIYDTFNFTRIGRIHVKDPIVGPLRAVLPLNGENPAACTATAPIVSMGYTGVTYAAGAAVANDCIVVKLAGSAVGGGVMVVNVTKADILSGP